MGWHILWWLLFSLKVASVVGSRFGAIVDRVDYFFEKDGWFIYEYVDFAYFFIFIDYYHYFGGFIINKKFSTLQTVTKIYLIYQLTLFNIFMIN